MARSKFSILSLLLLAVLPVFLLSCQEEEPEQHMVLEGWIEEGKAPIVMLHYAYNMDDKNVDKNATMEDVFRSQLVTLAKVSISDGENEVILTSSVNSKYMLPYIYTTAHMTGEAGKTYTITASRSGNTVTAKTTLPQVAARMDSLTIKTEHDSLVSVMAHVRLPEGENRQNIVFFVRKKEERQFFACPFGVVALEKESMPVPVYSPQRAMVNASHFYNTDTTTYYLHVAAVDDMSYKIWEGYSAQSINQGMYFMTIYQNMPSNVSSGRGYWCGYNSGEYPFTLLRDTTFRY